jgi:Domain of unknown function (DUF4347)/Bacterial cadherin-like domain
MTNSIIFVDSSLQDYQSLIAGEKDSEVVILNDNFSGITQITKALAGKSGIDAIHILSHGSSGSVTLGSDTLNNQDLAQFSQEIQGWKKSLTPNADILLYGCDVAQGENGLQFVQNLHQLTQADIAASDDKTGKGGDWELETQVGEIETPPIIPDHYDYTLAAPIANADTKGVTVDGAKTNINVLANDSDPDGDKLRIQSVTTPTKGGTVTIEDDIDAGGEFTTAGGVSANNIAKWNGTTWAPLGTGLDSMVHAITIKGNDIYAGGNFTNAGGGGANKIAKWNGTNWSPLGSGLNGKVRAIAINGSDIYAGGWFTNAGGVSANYRTHLGSFPSSSYNNDLRSLSRRVTTPL